MVDVSFSAPLAQSLDAQKATCLPTRLPHCRREYSKISRSFKTCKWMNNFLAVGCSCYAMTASVNGLLGLPNCWCDVSMMLAREFPDISSGAGMLGSTMTLDGNCRGLCIVISALLHLHPRTDTRSITYPLRTPGP